MRVAGEMKLLVGAQNKLQKVDQYTLTGPSWPNSSSSLDPLAHFKTCSRKPSSGCLFNISADPSELNNLAEELPDVFNAMLQVIDTYQNGVYSPVRGSKDPEACNRAEKSYDGFWGPFIK